MSITVATAEINQNRSSPAGSLTSQLRCHPYDPQRSEGEEGSVVAFSISADVLTQLSKRPLPKWAHGLAELYELCIGSPQFPQFHCLHCRIGMPAILCC